MMYGQTKIKCVMYSVVWRCVDTYRRFEFSYCVRIYDKAVQEAPRSF